MTRGRRRGSGAEVAVDVRVPRVPGGRVRLQRTLERLGGLAADRAARPVALTFALVGDREMAELHHRFLGQEGPTDVLAFPLMEEPRLVADVVLDVDEARRQARRRGLPAYDEVVLYAVHGVLHLLGHDDHDPTARRRMRRAERVCLERLGIPPVFRRRRAT